MPGFYLMTTTSVFDRFDAPHQGRVVEREFWLTGIVWIFGMTGRDLMETFGQRQQRYGLDQPFMEKPNAEV